MRANDSGSHQSQTKLNSNDKIATLAKRFGTLAASVSVLFIASVLSLAVSSRSTGAEAGVASNDHASSVDVTTPDVINEVADTPTVIKTSGNAVNVKYSSSSTTSSNSSQNSSTTSLNVNGQDVPVNDSGSVTKVIHTTGPDADINISIDSNSSSEYSESGGGL